MFTSVLNWGMLICYANGFIKVFLSLEIKRGLKMLFDSKIFLKHMEAK